MKRRVCWPNRIFYLLNSLFWCVVMFIIMYPLYLVLIASVSDPDAVIKGEVIWRPIGFTMEGYKALFEYQELLSSYRNSIIYTLISTVLSIIVTLGAAYTLSRPKFKGKGLLNFYFVFTMFFNGGLIPTFLVMKDLHLYNTPWIIILMNCVSVWNLMVARTYIQNSVPHELYEAAMLDGASHFQYFFGVVLPLSRTIMAVLSVYYGVAKWNDYFTGLVYLRDRSLLPLQTVLREILATLQVNVSDLLAGGDLTAEAIEAFYEATRVANLAKYCIIVVATVPVAILYAFMQRYFEKGVMIGSLKG